mmetsp:Transcript_4507/g.9858  ORF Transcript_4507/g.9858 Transcript_4507/m.9858 type:complete len:203 (-) Transcript_4507:153-761(-)
MLWFMSAEEAMRSSSDRAPKPWRCCGRLRNLASSTCASRTASPRAVKQRCGRTDFGRESGCRLWCSSRALVSTSRRTISGGSCARCNWLTRIWALLSCISTPSDARIWRSFATPTYSGFETVRDTQARRRSRRHLFIGQRAFGVTRAISADATIWTTPSRGMRLTGSMICLRCAVDGRISHGRVWNEGYPDRQSTKSSGWRL